MRNPLNVPILLASTSPRRQELLRAARLPVTVVEPDADERARRGEGARALAARLAREKAESVVTRALWEHGAALIIAADTVVVTPKGNRLLGKPRNPAEARKMLARLSGSVHTVHTGYCLLAVARALAPERVVRVVTTKVRIRKLSGPTIDEYVRTGEPMDKAGAYAAQGVGMGLIESIQGSYTNVVGLPIAQLLGDLESRWGITPFGEDS